MSYKTPFLILLLVITNSILVSIPPFFFGIIGAASGVKAYELSPAKLALGGVIITTSVGRAIVDTIKPAPLSKALKANRAFALGSTVAFTLLYKLEGPLSEYLTNEHE